MGCTVIYKKRIDLLLMFWYNALVFQMLLREDSLLKRRVLIVDDDPVIHVSLMELLSHDDLEIYSVYHPLDGFLWLKKASVDLIICDVGLPKMNGLEFIRQLRKKKRYVDVLFFTGVSAQIKSSDIKELNVVDVVNKGDYDAFCFKEQIYQLLFGPSVATV